ncbi:MAG TPA: glycosyltransferase [Pirellulales bacterium]|nr:glycosyltransferase [Pirellulales bacterium]
MSASNELDALAFDVHGRRSSGGRTSHGAATSRFDLDVGIIYSGERHFMTPLVSSLADSVGGITPRLILVDNASADGVADWARPMQTKVLRNEKPLGYAANLNRILSASTSRYVLLMNTDMYFGPADQCLAKMVAFMDERPRTGISICQIYRPDGSYGFPARRFPTLRTIAARRLGLARLLKRPLGEHLYQDRPITDCYPCDWVSGCFMLVRRDAIQDVGRFDERYVKYFEDVDICLRMARAGWQVMFNGGTRCFHHEQRASRKAFSRDAWRHGRAYLRWLMKWGLTLPSSGELTASRAEEWLTTGKRIDAAHIVVGPPHGGLNRDAATQEATANRPAA